MKTCIKELILLPALIAGLGLTLAGQATAQTFTNLHNFAGPPGDGANPAAGLILSGNTLYGTTQYGGTNGNGMVFKVNTNGTGFTRLHDFNGDDGANPAAGLILSGSALYGTAQYGGTNGNGTVFALNTNGSGFTNLHAFTALDSATGTTNNDGAYPAGGLLISGSTLFGTAQYGGANGDGTVFALNTNGLGFTNLHAFTALDPATQTTNNDGANPVAGLILSGNTLFGTAQYGGANGDGTVFALNTNGTGFSTLHTFADSPGDGANPSAALITSGNTLYGTAPYGGSAGEGIVFKVNTNGSAFTNLYSFTGGSDGGLPVAGLILSGQTLYGTAATGGGFYFGTVFAVDTNGMGLMTLYSFTAETTNSSGTYTNTDGAIPIGGLLLSGNTLYGTAQSGGTNNNGSVFSLATNFVAPYQVYGYVRDDHGTPIVGVHVSASDGLGHLASGTTDGSGLYAINVGTGDWDISVNCFELASLNYGCPGDQYAYISGGNSEIDFTVCGGLQVTTTNLPVGTVNLPYDQFLQASSCGNIFTWSLNSGALPPGLQFNSSGELFGNPTTAGLFPFSVQVSDDYGNTTNQSLSLTIGSTIPVLSAPARLNNGKFRLALNGSAGNYYTIQFSTNLITWLPLLITNPPTAQPMYLDFPTTNKAGFYRAYQSGIPVAQSVFSFGTGAAGTPVFYVNATNGVAVIPITRANGLASSACVNYSISGATAVPYCDFTPVSGTLCYSTAVSSNSISIPVSIPCTTNQSTTAILHLSDTNGNNLLNALLVIQRPAPVLAVSPLNPLVLFTPLDDPCTPAVLTISNAGPAGSLLNYQLSVVDTNQSKYITLNGGDGALGASGSLLSGQSVSESFYVPPKYYYLQQPTNPAAIPNMTVPLNIHIPDIANSTDVRVNLGVTNSFSLLLGTWGGSCSAGHVSGLWTLVVQRVFALDSGELTVIGTFTLQATIPYDNIHCQLVGIGNTFQGVTAVTNTIYACGPTLVLGVSILLPTPYDSGVTDGSWSVGGTIPVNVLSGAVIQGSVPFPGNRCYLFAPWGEPCPPYSGDYGGTGVFTGSRQGP